MVSPNVSDHQPDNAASCLSIKPRRVFHFHFLAISPTYPTIRHSGSGSPSQQVAGGNPTGDSPNQKARRRNAGLVMKPISGGGNVFLQKTGDQREQLFFLIRLSEIFVNAQFQRVVAMLGSGTRGNHEDGNLPRPFIIAYITG